MSREIFTSIFVRNLCSDNLIRRLIFFYTNLPQRQNSLRNQNYVWSCKAFQSIANMVFTSDKNGGKTSRDSVLIGIPTHTQWQCCGTGFARIQIIFVSFVHKTKLKSKIKSNMNVTYMKTCLMGQVFVCRRVLRFILWLIKQTKFVILLRVLELTGNPDQSCTMLRPGQD